MEVRDVGGNQETVVTKSLLSRHRNQGKQKFKKGGGEWYQMAQERFSGLRTKMSPWDLAVSRGLP